MQIPYEYTLIRQFGDQNVIKGLNFVFLVVVMFILVILKLRLSYKRTIEGIKKSSWTIYI